MKMELGLRHVFDQPTLGSRQGAGEGLGHIPMLRCRAMNGQVRRVALTAGWLAIAALVSLGAAGIIGAMAHLPGTPSRAELTYSGDKAIGPRLEAAEQGLIDLGAEVRRLSELGRGALSALVNRDVDTLAEAVAAGKDLTVQIDTRASELRKELDTLPGIGPGEELVLSPETRDRRARALHALESTDGLATAWSRLAVGSVSATRITKLLTDHDTVTGEAVVLGRAGKYAEALERLAESDAIIAESRSLRDALAGTVDVGTLTTWLDLNAEYDTALRRLYDAVIASKGAVTPEVLAAFDAEAVARKRLPSDTKALVIILEEIGRGGLNEAVIAIEEARGRLDAALGRLGGAAGVESAPP
jgi:hypothetical protein